MIGDQVWTRTSGCADTACVEVRYAPRDGTVSLRDSKHSDRPPLVFTMSEWAAFVKGVEAGEFEVPVPGERGGRPDHPFVRSSDPRFGAAFGGGCDAPIAGTVCGWPEQAHPQAAP